MKKRLVIVIVVLVMGSLAFLSALLLSGDGTTSPATGTKKTDEIIGTMTPSGGIIHDQVDQATVSRDFSALKRPQQPPPSSTNEAPPEQGPQPERQLVEPPFYHVNAEKFASLTESQQSAVSAVMADYKEFYTEWTRSYPRDPGAWDLKMKEFQEEITRLIGPDASDQIFH
jgi:hypothetical protein